MKLIRSCGLVARTDIKKNALGANKFDYGMRESLSIMVNYRYYFDKMWNQAYNYQTDRTVTCSDLI